MVSQPRISLAKPLMSCDRMTPELPLAPLSEPEEIALHSADMLSSSKAPTSFTADLMVRVIFVPVSPSGTGKTFSSFIHSLFASRLDAPAKNIFRSCSALIENLHTIIPPQVSQSP